MIRLLLAALAVALPAHVEPQSSEAPAGARTTFSFLVEHGCDGSPTVQVAVQVPEGAFDLVPLPADGWAGTVSDDGRVVTFTGGPLPDDVEATFDFELVTPNQPGQQVLFPTVQTCEAGEIAWIDPGDEATEPAPRVLLTANDQPILPTTTTAAPTTTAPPTTVPPASTSTTTDDPGDGGDSGDGGMPTVVIGGLALLAAAAVGVVASRRARPPLAGWNGH